MDATFKERLEAIDWNQYHTAYGSAVKVPGQLLQLANGGEVAMAASHELWCGLCHQHAYVSSAALPALPFILEVFDRADEALTVEIVDILLGFASCTRPEDNRGAPPWIGELRQGVAAVLPRLRGLASHPNEDLAALAGLAVENLEGADEPA
ncbi:hypothetical protein [Singulisphaera sp. PoT]|uniref:hypothetical protein n=1 Tax=Singulisphaera sp. PoT TaxID=3411797 RepID=UPI003BF49C42